MSSPFPSRPLLPHLIAALALLAPPAARAADAPDDPRLACDRAAARAERTWNVPAGLLAAIGTVESGHADAGAPHRRAWPWSINAEGWSHFAGSKQEAVSLVRTLQARGLRFIDVGCFQVDLFYHPRAFASLEDAFDPDANAGAASRILTRARFGATGWEPAVAAYHSASLLRGAWYLQRVLAAWPAARARLAVLDAAPRPLDGHVALLSPAARLVRIVTPADPEPEAMPGLPEIISPTDLPASSRLDPPVGALPRVLTPPDAILPQPGHRL